jgi:hypothetical protein
MFKRLLEFLGNYICRNATKSALGAPKLAPVLRDVYQPIHTTGSDFGIACALTRQVTVPVSRIISMYIAEGKPVSASTPLSSC